MAELLHDRRSRANEPAVIDAHGATSWGVLEQRVHRLIHHLRGAGVQPGDRVGLLSGNRREVEEVLLACAHAGWLAVPINWHFAPDEVAYVLEDSGAVAVVADADFGDLAVAALELAPGAAPRSRLVFGGPVPSDGSHGIEDYEAALLASSPEEPADQMLGGVMFYTSGTTGRPKGVRNTGFQIGTTPKVLQLAASSMVNVGIPAEGRTLLCGPHYHSAQWAFSFFPLINGSTVVMQSRFDPEQLLDLIDEHEITNVHLVPTQFVRLLRVPEERRRAFRGDSLQLVLHGAAPCPPAVKRAMIEWWGPKVSEYYGATEGGIVTLISAEEWLAKPGSVGKAMPIMEIKVVNAEGDEAAPGEEGVIHVRNLLGNDFEYLNAPEKTAEAHSLAGFMTLGDIGYLDEDGYLFLSDRKIDMIISGGVNIYPAEIEAVLVEHPAIADVAVFGVPDEEFGEQVKAALQLVPGREWGPDLEAEIVALARGRLAGYKVPRSFDVVEQMPRSEAGKLLKRELRAPYWEGTGRKI
jgi:long-chain acyl-CoA synthetase